MFYSILFIFVMNCLFWFFILANPVTMTNRNNERKERKKGGKKERKVARRKGRDKEKAPKGLHFPLDPS